MNLDEKSEIIKMTSKLISSKRKELGLTLLDLGDMVGLSKAGMGHYDSGLREMSVSTFLQIAKVLGIKAEDFMLETSKVAPKKHMIKEFNVNGIVLRGKTKPDAIRKFSNSVKSLINKSLQS